MIYLRKFRVAWILILVFSLALSIFPVMPSNAAEPEQLSVKMISAGDSHATAILTDGSLWVWGINSHGQLGDGTTVTRHKPMRLMDNVAFVSAGGDYTMAIKEDGSLWGWGANSLGQLGDGTTIDHHMPVRIMDDVIYVSAGDTHTMAIKSNGTLWGWGGNHRGKIGDGTTPHRSSPVLIMDDVISVVAGYTFTAALKNENSLWVWGSNLNSALGDGTDIDRHSPVKIIDDAISVSGGGKSIFAVRKDGSLWSSGELNIHERRRIDVDFSQLQYGVVDVSVRQQHAVALKEDGTVWTWGNNSAGQRGDGTAGRLTAWNHQPAQVFDNVVSISAGRIFTMAIRSDGSLWVWGGNSFGQLGDDTTISRTTPTMIIPLIPKSPNSAVAEVSAASHHTMAIMEDGTLWAWGFNNTGQFGNGTTMNRNTPSQIGERKTWSNISSGTSHSAGIFGNNSLWAWGDNTHGQLGDNTTNGALFPIAVGEKMIFGGILVEPGRETRKWSSVSVGGSHMTAIQNNGTLWAWGNNNDGQLGDGTTSRRIYPTQIGEDKWICVSTNNFHTAAINEYGTLWTWGRNNHGQLGDGTEISRHSPVQVGTEWTNVSAGANHTVAIKDDGSLWAWGSNSRGQLGDGTTVDSLLPVRIGTDNNWSSVSAGAFHTAAIKTDGTLWTWGSNSFGQLGSGAAEKHYSPVKALENVRAVSAGFNNTFVIKNNGSLWGFGENSFSQLGDGTIENRREPVQIIDGEGIKVRVNGELVTFEGLEPIIANGRIFVPVRGGLFSTLGFELQAWFPETENKVILTRADYVLTFEQGSNFFTVNDVIHNLDSPAQFVWECNDFVVPVIQPVEWMSIPLRQPLESIGYNVEWDATTNTVLITLG